MSVAWDYKFKYSGEVDGTQSFRKIIIEHSGLEEKAAILSVNENWGRWRRAECKEETGWEISLGDKTVS